MNEQPIGIVYDALDSAGGSQRVVYNLFRELRMRNKPVFLFTNYIARHLFQPDENLVTFDLEQPVNDTRRVSAQTFVEKLALECTQRKILLLSCHNFPSYYWAWHSQEIAYTIYFHEPPRFLYDRIMRKGAPALPPTMASTAPPTVSPGVRIRRKIEKMNLRPREKKAVLNAEKLFGNSAYTGSWLPRIYRKQAQTIYNGISLPEPRAERPVCVQARTGRKSCANNEVPLRLFTIGRLTALKNVASIIRAVPIIKKILNREVQLEIAGSGPEKSNLSSLTRSLRLENEVHLVGHLTDGEVTAKFTETDVGIFVPVAEPFGLVPLEMLAHSLPVVMSAHGGPAEIADLLNYPYRCAATSPNEIARTVFRIVQERNTMDFSGYRKKITEHFLFSRFVTEFWDAHQALFDR